MTVLLRVVPGGQLAQAVDQRTRRARMVTGHGYHRRNWVHVRKARLELDGYRCQIQGGRCTGRATHVHLDPARAGNHDAAMIDDCLSCCAPCSGQADGARARGYEGGEG